MYGFLTDVVNPNKYYISKDSNMDYETFKLIMEGEMLEFQETDIVDEKNMDGNIMLVEEKYIDSERVKEYFKNLLQDFIKYNKKVHSNDVKNLSGKYTYVFNCTNGLLSYNFNREYVYEKTLSLLYQKHSRDIEAITIMDGEFLSLFPHDIKNNLFTLTDVKYTPLIRRNYPIEDFVLNSDELLKLRDIIESRFLEYIPTFLNTYSYHSYFISQKNKTYKLL